MAADTSIPIRFGKQLDHRHADLGLVRQAVARHPEREQYCEMVVRRQLDEGFSGARVYEAEWVTADAGASDWSVLKIDRATRLAKEARLSKAYPDALSFARVVTTSFDSEAPVAGEPGCLMYAHAGSNFTGEIESLTRVFARAMSDGQEAEARARELLESALGILRKQLHKGGADRPGSGLRQLDFYLKRWLPTAVVCCKQVAYDAANGRLTLSSERPELELEPGRDEATDRSAIGRVIWFDGLEHFLAEDQVFVNVPQHASYLIEGITPEHVRDVLKGATPKIVRVEGTLRSTLRSAYAEKLADLGLDLDAATLRVEGLEFANPLLPLSALARSWTEREPKSFYCFGHGDLHGGNVLCVGHHLMVIDHALAGPGHPSWADAARLVGSLWRTAMVPALEPAEIAASLDQAFRQSRITATGKTGTAARLLRHAVKAALRHGPAIDAAQRDLWIDLHHFGWIALKWPGEPSSRLATLLLAAIAGERVSVAEQALALSERTRLPAHADPRQLMSAAPAVVGEVARMAERLDPTHELSWSLREALQQLVREQGLELDSGDKMSGGLLGRLLDKAITGAWSAIDTEEAARLKLAGAQGLSPRDRVVLTDILFFVCLFCWQDEAFGLILELTMDGDRRVEAEAAMVLGWLLGLDTTRQQLEGRRELKRRTQHTLNRPDLVWQIVLANRARMGTWRSLERAAEKPVRDLTSLTRIFWLRPFDSKADLRSEDRSSTSESLLHLLANSISLAEGEKLEVARWLKIASEQQRRHLKQVFGGCPGGC